MTPSSASNSACLYLIDSLSVLFQSFYAVRSLTNAEGVPTNAVFGYLKKLQMVTSEYRPSHLLAVFDSPGPCFRNEIFEGYKAHREEPPEELRVQVPLILEVLEAMGVPAPALPGDEADDLIGTLARQGAEQGMDVVIISADKDLFQLVSDRVSLLRTTREGLVRFGPDEVREKMGVSPGQIVDYLALVGDSSDNIPGVPRIGPKTAASLIGEFGSLENLLADPERIRSASQREQLVRHAEQALLSQRLARIDCHAPCTLDLEAARFRPRLDSPDLLAVYRRLGFRSLLPASDSGAEASKVDGAARGSGVPSVAGQMEMALESYLTVLSPAALEEVVREIRRAGRCAVDTETTDVDVMRAGLVGISLSWQAGHAAYVPVGHRLGGDAGRQLPLEAVRRALGPLLADGAVRKVAQNAKFDLRILARHGLPMAGLEFDTMLAGYLLNPEARHGLKSMAFEFLGVRMTEIAELIGKGRQAVTMADIEIERAAAYACADADMTLRLAGVLGPRLEAAGLVPLFREIEMPLVEVLDAMEAEGVTIDPLVLADLGGDLRSRIAGLAQRIYTMVGRSFNLNSPRQVADVLFTDLGLKATRKTSTGLSTDSEVLEELAAEHPLPALLLEFRRYDKILSTYVDALPQLVHPATGRIHTSYNQFVAATGRLSSSNPNLQNIPVRTDLGRAIRRAFVPNGPDHVFLAADYSQIELRILAHVTGDEALRRAFRDNLDIHTQTASRIFGVAPAEVTSDMRSQAKVINFGILYGMGAHRLSRELGIAHAQAQKFIDDYFAAYPAVRAWSERLIEEARRTGHVSTLSGRRRLVPNLTSRNRNEQANAVRMAVNTPIQGTAADLIKIAMIAIHGEIARSGRRARMVLQVHDELVFTVPRDEVDGLEPVVRGLMEGAMDLEVPLKVDIEVGRNWAEC